MDSTLNLVASAHGEVRDAGHVHIIIMFAVLFAVVCVLLLTRAFLGVIAGTGPQHLSPLDQLLAALVEVLVWDDEPDDELDGGTTVFVRAIQNFHQNQDVVMHSALKTATADTAAPPSPPAVLRYLEEMRAVPHGKGTVRNSLVPAIFQLLDAGAGPSSTNLYPWARCEVQSMASGSEQRGVKQIDAGQNFGFCEFIRSKELTVGLLLLGPGARYTAICQDGVEAYVALSGAISLVKGSTRGGEETHHVYQPVRTIPLLREGLHALQAGGKPCLALYISVPATPAEGNFHSAAKELLKKVN